MFHWWQHPGSPELSTMSSLGVHVGPLRDGYWHCMGASVPGTVLHPAETSILLGTCWQIFSIEPTASLILGEKR